MCVGGGCQGLLEVQEAAGAPCDDALRPQHAGHGGLLALLREQ